MTTVDLHDAVLVLPGGSTLAVTNARVTVDESWSPFVQAAVVCKLPEDVATLDVIDPRGAGRALLQLRRDFGDAWSNAEFTAAHPIPATNADLSAAYPGWTGAQITAAFFRAWNSFGIRESSAREFNLDVRAREVDHLAATVTLSLMSDEMLLHDFARVATTKYTNTQTSLRALVNFVLAQIDAALQPGTDDATLVAGALEWSPGQSGWDFLRSPIEAAGLRLWCDEARLWRLTQRTPVSPGSLVLRTGDFGTVTSAVDRIDRDGKWCDALVIEYRWVEGTGTQQTAYDVAGDPSTARKVLHLIREQKFPGAGAAASMLSRYEGRGHELDITAVADYSATPGQAFTAELPLTDIQTGLVSAITWELPAATMTVKTRELLDTPETAWVFDPAGIAWNDVPAGIDWTEDI